MLIDINKVEFSLDPSFGDWINMELDDEYIESVELFDGDEETDELGLSSMYYVYLVCAKLLTMRSCDYLYIANAGEEYNSSSFQELDLAILNRTLPKLR